MTKARYDDIAKYYEGVIGPFERWMLPGLREKALKLLPADSCVLEVGAGTGLNFVYYPSGVSGVATEVSREMLKLAGEKSRPERVSLVQSRAEDLPFQSHSFAAAFATLVFCSVAEPVKGLAEMCRVVRPGGMVVLLEHVRPAGVLGLLFDLMNVFTWRLFEDNVNRRTAELARKAGLEVIRIEKSRLGIINLIVCRTPAPFLFRL